MHVDEPFADGIAAIALGDGAAWVALEGAQRIMRVAPDGRTTHAAWLRAPAAELAYGGGRLWASVPERQLVARIDPDRVDSATDIRVGPDPAGIAFTRRRVFVANTTQHTVAVLDPAHIRRGPVRRLRVPLNPYGMAARGGDVWVTGQARDTATRIDP
jgi:hypothetical protein